MNITGTYGRVILGGALLATSVGATAQQAVTTQDVDQRLRILERKLEIEKEAADAKAKDATSTSFGDKGLSVKKGDFELKIKGLLQGDIRTFLDDEGAFNDTAVLRRLRPTFEGSFGKLVAFRLTPEFAGDSATTVDAYIELKFDPANTLRAGKVKGPVSLERLQSGGAITFIERGFPTELAPNRDLGLQLQGELFDKTLSYTLGYYNGTPDGRDAVASDVDSDKEVGFRLFAEPFKNGTSALQGLGFGVGSSFGSKDQGAANAAGSNNFLSRYRTPGQNVFFSYRGAVAANPNATPPVAASSGVYADGDHVRISPQLYYYNGSFGLLAEHISSEQELTINTTSAKLEHTAYQAVVSYVLTGEDASYRGVAKPANAYQVGGPGWGAFEIAARYGVLEIDEDAFPVFANPNSAASEAASYALGVNWYLNSNVKVALNYTDTRFEGGAAGGTDRNDEKTVFTRLQLAF